MTQSLSMYSIWNLDKFTIWELLILFGEQESVYFCSPWIQRDGDSFINWLLFCSCSIRIVFHFLRRHEIELYLKELTGSKVQKVRFITYYHWAICTKIEVLPIQLFLLYPTANYRSLHTDHGLWCIRFFLKNVSRIRIWKIRISFNYWFI